MMIWNFKFILLLVYIIFLNPFFNLFIRWNVLENKYDVWLISTNIVVILKGRTIESKPLRTVRTVTSPGNKSLEFDLTLKKKKKKKLYKYYSCLQTFIIIVIINYYNTYNDIEIIKSFVINVLYYNNYNLH